MKRKSRSFGVLHHEHAKRGGHGVREMSIRVRIDRNPGAPKGKNYDAKACVAGSTSTAAVIMQRKALRKSGVNMDSAQAWDNARCGVAYGPTPTVAVKRALRVLVGKAWSRGL